MKAFNDYYRRQSTYCASEAGNLASADVRGGWLLLAANWLELIPVGERTVQDAENLLRLNPPSGSVV
jgi:hypothetical protein